MATDVPPSSSRLRIIGTVLLVLISIVGLARVQRHQIATDFPSYFFAARSAQLGHSPYEFQAASDIAVSAGVHEYFPYIYPPLLAHVLESVPLGRVVPAQIAWGGLMVACYVAMLIMLAKLLGMSDGERVPEPIPGLWLTIVAASAWILVRAAREDFYNGQINCLTALLSITALYLSEARRPQWGGAALALAILLKISPIVFCLYLLLRKQTRTLAWGAGFLILFVGLDVARFGTGDWFQFRQVASAAGYSHPPLGIKSFDVSPASLPSLFSNLLGHDSVWISRGTVLILLLMGGSILWFGRRGVAPAERGPAFGACALLTMLSAPLVWNHHFVVLVPVLALLAQHVYLNYPHARTRILAIGGAFCFIALPWDRRLVDGVAEHTSWRLLFGAALNNLTLLGGFVLCLWLWSRTRSATTAPLSAEN